MSRIFIIATILIFTATAYETGQPNTLFLKAAEFELPVSKDTRHLTVSTRHGSMDLLSWHAAWEGAVVPASIETQSNSNPLIDFQARHKSPPLWGKIKADHVRSQLLLHFKEDSLDKPLNSGQTCRQQILSILDHPNSLDMYLPQNTFAIMATFTEAEALEELECVHWLGWFHSAFKADVQLTGLAFSYAQSPTPTPTPTDENKEFEHPLITDSTTHAAVTASFHPAAFFSTEDLNTFVQVLSSSLPVAPYYASVTSIRFISPLKHVAKLVEVLSALDVVHSVEKQDRNEIHNSIASNVVQDQNTGTHPVFDKGLTGENQLLGVGDSGLDPKSCFFADTWNTKQIPYCNQCPVEHYADVAGLRYLPNPSTCTFTVNQCIRKYCARKLVAYWAFADDVDYYAGHGSHVSGTAAGKSKPGSSSSLASYNGAAPDARIIFSDLGSETKFGNSGIIVTPPDMATQLFPWSYNLGVRIHTNSWGGGNTYTTASASVDQFSHTNRDFLLLFAAGNSGSDGPGHVGSQALAKNTIAVGASRTPASHFQANADVAAFEQWMVWKNVFCSNKAGTVKYTETQTICTYLNNQLNTPINDCTVLSQTFCSLINSSSTLCCGGSGFASGSKEKEFYDLARFHTPCCITDIKASSSYDKSSEVALNTVGIQTMANFSSRGPTPDNRIKPDISAPGNAIISALGQPPAEQWQAQGDRCGTDPSKPGYALASSSGTSMATPAVAGAAILVRQYFVEGWGVCGKKDFNHAPTTVSAALVKASIIHSGTNMTGNFAFPSLHALGSFTADIYTTGFGLIKIRDVLRFEGDTFVLDYHDESSTAAIQTTSSSYTYTYTVSSSARSFKATLVWTDPPSSSTASINLVNDLDLKVTTPASTVLTGNSRHYPTRDSRNNVEQIEVQSPATGTYTVTVSASSVPLGPQTFALVVTYQGSTAFSNGACNNPLLTKAGYNFTEQCSSDFNTTALPATPSAAAAITPGATLLMLIASLVVFYLA